MQPEVDTYAAGLYKGYMAIMPPEFQIPNDANDELLNLFQNAIDEDVRAQFEIGLEFINEDPPNYYAAHYWMQLASLQGHPQAEICLKTLTKFGDDMFQNDTDIKLRKKKNRKSLSLRSLKLDDINQPESATPSPRSSINTANQSPLANDIQIPKVAHDIKSSSSTGIDSARFSNQPTTFPSMDVKSTDQVKKEMEFAKPTDTKCTPGLSSFSCF
ncbi:hypothetical protein HDV02_005133 [Globomyces sp. JEL0801]|nr:hypothetical protein HDV02_005133 [Globomyces sp. JEL0801]